MCTFENWIRRLSKSFRFQTDQKLAVGYLVTWFGEYFETVLVVNGRHLMWILPLRYSCLFQTLTERMKNLFSFSNWSPISFVIALDCWWNQMSFSRGHFSRLNAFQFTNQYLQSLCLFLIPFSVWWIFGLSWPSQLQGEDEWIFFDGD